MVSVRFSPKNKRAKTKTLIRVSIAYQGERTVFSTGLSIPPEHWDLKRSMPNLRIRNEEVSRINEELLRLEGTIRRVYNQLLEISPCPIPEVFKQSVLKAWKGEEKKVNPVTFLEFYEKFIDDCEKGKRLTPSGTILEENSIKPYRTTLGLWKEFEISEKKQVLLTKFSQDYHDRFLEFLEMDMDVSRNASSKNIMCIQQVLKWAVEKKVIGSNQVNEIKFSTRREESDNIYLSEDELAAVMKLKYFKSKLEEQVRDIFIVGSYTGLRFSDYANLSFENVRGTTINLIQTKTKSKVEIPIHPFVENILKKYNYTLPKSPTNQEFNRTLKDICQRIPELGVEFSKQITKGRQKRVLKKKKWEMVMTHTARRSFCTNMYNRGVPVKTIMAFSGHKTEKNFHRYVKSTIQDHAKIIQKLW